MEEGCEIDMQVFVEERARPVKFSSAREEWNGEIFQGKRVAERSQVCRVCGALNWAGHEGDVMLQLLHQCSAH